MTTGLGGGLSGIWVVGTMVTLGGNIGGVSFGTLGVGAGQSVWSTLAGEGCGAFMVGAVEGLSVTWEKMRVSVWMAETFSWPSVANGVGVGCDRALVSAWAASVAALVELPDGTEQSWGKTPLFWKCVLGGYMECICGDIGSGQGQVQGTIR